MTRLVLARNDLLTSFDLRAQIFRVNVEFSTCYHGINFFSKKCPKVTFWLEKKNFGVFFETLPFGPLMTDKISKKFFSSGKGPIGQYFEKLILDFNSQNGYQTTPFELLMIVNISKKEFE